jgi:PIN domain nuclease of toxin-antitoxin system
MIAVLDASALLALLLGEPGGERVRAVLADSAIAMVNLSEVIGLYVRNGATEVEIREVLAPLPVERVAVDEEMAYAAGLLIASTASAGLSLGDRCCLALARRLGATAWTSDRAWPAIAKRVGVEIELIR